MFIRRIETNAIIPKFRNAKTVTTTYGMFKDYGIVIETYKDKNKEIVGKQFIVWNDRMQKIINKLRNKDGKFKEI